MPIIRYYELKCDICKNCEWIVDENDYNEIKFNYITYKVCDSCHAYWLKAVKSTADSMTE